MTIKQALRLPYSQWQALTRKEVEARVRAQAALYARARACCFATRWAAASAVEEYGVESTKVHVVGIGRNHVAGEPARDWTNPRFLFVGGDWQRKNGDAVLRAFARLRSQVPDARLDLVGNHPEVSGEGIYCHGWLSLANAEERAELDRLFAEATCFVMPSHYEPAGIAYLEAAAAGLPAIGSSVGGAAELIGDGGRVIDPSDEEALFAAMLDLTDPETAAAAGTRARAHSAKFTWEQVAARLLRGLEPPDIDLEALSDFLD